MPGNPFWDAVMPMTETLGEKVAREFPGVEAEDIAQEMCEHAIKKETTLVGYPTNVVRKCLLEVGRMYAWRERYSYIHYSTKWMYTPNEVRALFSESFFDKTLWETMPQKDDGMSITTKNVVVSLWDIANAYEQLDPAEQVIIARAYDLREKLTETESRRLRRAITRATQYLNVGMLPDDD